MPWTPRWKVGLRRSYADVQLAHLLTQLGLWLEAYRENKFLLKKQVNLCIVQIDEVENGQTYLQVPQYRPRELHLVELVR